MVTKNMLRSDSTRRRFLAGAASGNVPGQPRRHGRSSFAILTARGQDALRRAWPVYREAIHRHLGAHLTAEQCRGLAALLGAAAAAAEIVTVASGQPRQRSY
jgi:hypothetical protein